MFSSDKQISRVCMTLLSHTHQSSLWTPEGPTPFACDLVDSKGGHLSSGEAAILGFCFVLWNSHKFGTMAALYNLDFSHRVRIGKLLCCPTPESIEAWIEANSED